MTTKIEIQSEQEFTYNGRVGAFMFVCGPIVSGLGYVWLLREMESSYADLAPPFLVEVAGGIVFLIGAVMMLVGRTLPSQCRSPIRPLCLI